jgi:maltose alpha-D-glucosyltransferase/alpha-amylase
MPRGWLDLFDPHNLPQLESDILPAFLLRQRWFVPKDQRVRRADVVARGEITLSSNDSPTPESFLASVVETTLELGERSRYFLPLATVWSSAEIELRQELVPATVAWLRQFRREGVLVDALSQDGFPLAAMDAIRHEATVQLAGGAIRCRKTSLFDLAEAPERLVLRRGGVEQLNSSVFFEDYGMLKLYRRLQPGPHPEIEMSRFFFERAGFANTPPLLAYMELDLDGERGPETCALGALFAFIRNQGDGWTQALDYLTRYLDDALVSSGTRSFDLPDPDVFFLALARQLGIRTAEMHRALAEQGGNDPNFAPEPITAKDVAEWRGELEIAAADMLSRLERGRAKLPTSGQEFVERLIAQRDHLIGLIRSLAPDEIKAMKTRLHGNFHLGQVLAVKNDFFVIDFEGDPARTPAERRRKNSPLRDVAGMIRSLDYASVSAVRRLAEARPTAAPRMTQLAESWRQRAVDGFRAAYHKMMRGCVAYPTSKTEARELLTFFTLENLIHEATYELANRPDWIDVPIRGILDILTKTAQRGEFPPC